MAKRTINTNQRAENEVEADKEFNESLYGRPHFRYYDNHRIKSQHEEVEQSLRSFCGDATELLKVCHPPIQKKNKVGIHFI